jgi:two-component system response regulator NreC
MNHDTEQHKTETLKVVIIDDHEVVREGLVIVINSQSDMKVVGEANTAREGLELIIKTKPHIIITDISMPGENAFEFLKEYRAASPGVKVVFLSAYATDSNLEKAIKSGGAGFIAKSEPSLKILSALRDVINGHSYFSSEAAERIVHIPNGLLELGNAVVKGELLSPRELEVLCSVAKGFTAKEIATTLKISSKTVERHKSNIMAKLGIHTQVDLTRYAIREGLVVA